MSNYTWLNAESRIKRFANVGMPRGLFEGIVEGCRQLKSWIVVPRCRVWIVTRDDGGKSWGWEGSCQAIAYDGKWNIPLCVLQYGDGTTVCAYVDELTKTVLARYTFGYWLVKYECLVKSGVTKKGNTIYRVQEAN